MAVGEVVGRSTQTKEVWNSLTETHQLVSEFRKTTLNKDKEKILNGPPLPA